MTNKNYNVTKLRLAHINDTHSYFEPTSLQLAINVDGVELNPFVSAGGFARIATRVDQLKQQAEQQQQGFLFLHAGDCFQGTLYFSLFKGEANATLLNALNIDAMALGNHELDMGNEPVAHFVDRIQFPLLAGNWDLSNELPHKRFRLQGHRNVVPYDTDQHRANWIEKAVGDDRVAIFSLALDKMAEISNPDWDTPFVDAVETAKNTVAAIRQSGINKIILLSHMGYEADLDLANHVDGISVIVGGHSHRLQGDFSLLGLAKDDPYGVRVNQTYVVQSGMHALSLGHCDLEFAPDGTLTRFEGKNELLLGRRLFIDASMNETHNDSPYQVARSYIDAHPNVIVCKKQQSLQTLLEQKYTSQVRQLQKQIIATCDQTLRHTRIPDQQGPSDIAPLVAESFAYQMKKLGHQVDFAIHNAGGVRNSLSAGQVSVADIAGKLLPFAVPIGIYYIEGREIANILEGAINNALNNGVVGTGDGSYPYTHNLCFEYCCDEPLGARIKRLKLLDNCGQWQEVEDDKVYCGTSSAYTMKGKEGYEAMSKMQGEGTITTYSMADCFINFVKDHPEALNRLNTPSVDQKWHKGC
ncbi:bifunctional metallophosphatase/5'-nucleotidase [Vibrio sinaloensis]|uniref:bifunctional metallophosphatase/5'-nucleotidase n=1 Tax=Photobacterium sp. (strain ATCC 43367) TaxID=379097 RepID=UPI00204A4309|nr:5'-nucleotidase C-terminal domain-containing protein [Vibrio sinaloensis]UPQ89884.1 5'-nucleotidase C-terminal domain-containing protein [Vibrio sinaloensis]